MVIAKAYVANLGKYNEGQLVGGWISLPTTDEKIFKFLRDVVGIDAQYEEYAIHDWESDILEYPGEFVDLLEINRQCGILDEMDDDERKVYELAQSAGFDVDVDTFDVEDYFVIGDCYNDTDLGYAIITDIYGDVSEVANPQYYIDKEAIYNDLLITEESSFREQYEEDAGDDYDEEDFQIEFWHYFDDLADEIVEHPEAYLGDNLEDYFDYEAYGRDVRINDGGVFCDGYYIARL